MAELKPRPFCGGEAKVTCYPEWGWAQYEVKCNTCDATFEKAFYTEERAAEAWNRRAGDGK